MISEWAEKGDARSFITKNPDADRLGILIEALQGLIYLHTFKSEKATKERHIVHASLRGRHILIGNDGVARLSDFALAFFKGEQTYSSTRPPKHHWSAPEVLQAEEPSIGSDTYSFGMVILELITNADPFAARPVSPLYRSPYPLQRAIIGGTRPAFPKDDFSRFGLVDENSALWRMMKQSWAPDPETRPSDDDVLALLRDEHAKAMAAAQVEVGPISGSGI